MTDEAAPRRRQARGERRIAELLDAAAAVFAESGYAGATTNAIAARAGASPGTLYQFFSNKEKIAEALAARYLAELSAAHDAAFTPDVGSLPLDDLVDRVVDPLLEFNLANPGFRALLADPGVPAKVATAKQPLSEAMAGRLEALLELRGSTLSPEERTRSARVMMAVFGSLVPLVVAAHGDERAAVIAEVKRVARGYLAQSF